MTTQHNMPPMPKTWQERMDKWQRTTGIAASDPGLFLESELRDLRAHAAALAEKVRELEDRPTWETVQELERRIRTLQSDLAAARQPVEAEPVAIKEIVGVDGNGTFHTLRINNVGPAIGGLSITVSLPATQQPATVDSAIHYPECWDTAAYPTVESALSAVYDHFKCSECATPPAGEALDAIQMIVDRDTPPDNRDEVVDHDIVGNPITRGDVEAFAKAMRKADGVEKAIADLLSKISLAVVDDDADAYAQAEGELIALIKAHEEAALWKGRDEALSGALEACERLVDFRGGGWERASVVEILTSAINRAAPSKQGGWESGTEVV